eukprot:2037219-Amphidinium_carterae.1
MQLLLQRTFSVLVACSGRVGTGSPRLYCMACTKAYLEAETTATNARWQRQLEFGTRAITNAARGLTLLRDADSQHSATGHILAECPLSTTVRFSLWHCYNMTGTRGSFFSNASLLCDQTCLRSALGP